MQNKGICNLAAIPLRKSPESGSEMISQLLFGDTFSIHQTTENGWVGITTDADHYDGYISDKQFTPYTENTLNWQTTCKYPYTLLNMNSGVMMIPAGSSLPTQKHFKLGNNEYQQEDLKVHSEPGNIEQVALQYLNVPYLWGGKTPFGIDCSGLTQVVFKQSGINLPRDAYQQAELGESVSFVAETRSGDLAFFDNDEGRIVHVGIMLGNKQIIHASGKVRIDDLDHYGIMNLEEKQYSHKLRIIKRII